MKRILKYDGGIKHNNVLNVILFIKKKTTLKSEKYYQRFPNVSQIKSEEKTCNKQHRTDSK